MPTIQLFLQFEGHRGIDLIEIDANASVHEILTAALVTGLAKEYADGAFVFGAHCDDPLELEMDLHKAGIRDKHRVHVHRCRKIEVTLHFNDLTEKLHLPPSATVERVKRQFIEQIHMPPVDATEHVLQLCGSTDRPEPDIHIGALVSCSCSLCFDLVPIKRIEG